MGKHDETLLQNFEKKKTLSSNLKINSKENFFENLIRKEDDELFRFNKNLRRDSKNLDPILSKLKSETKYLINSFGKPILILKEGEILGHTALVSNRTRNSSVVSLTDCDVMVFNKDHFDYIKGLYQKEFQERKKFMVRIFPLLEQVSEEKKLLQFLQYFAPKNFTKVI